MRKLLPLLAILLIAPIFAHAQHADEDDPFKRDPLFTKSINELLGISQPSEEAEQDRDTENGDRAIRRLSATGLDLGGSFEAGPFFSNALFSQYPNMPAVHFNRVNGLFIGIKQERMQWHRRSSFLDIPQIHLHGLIGWGTASKNWEYAIGLEKLFGRSNRFMVGFEYHNATATEDYNRAGLVETSVTSFLAGYDYLDYYNQEGIGLYSVYRTNKWIEAAVTYNRSSFSSLEQNTGYSLFGYTRTYRPNPAIDQFAETIDLDIYSVSLSLNPRNVLLSDYFTISGTVTAELADNSASDEGYRYNRYRSEVKLFYNFEPGSVLRWRMQAGGISGDAPDFKQFYLGGIGTLRGSPYKVFSGDRMLLSNIEVQFGRPSNRIGEWIRDYNLHILFFLDSGWTNSLERRDTNLSDVPENQTVLTPVRDFSDFKFADLQHDAGIGIGTGVFRLELAWPLRTFDSSPTLWLRLNPTF